MDVRGMSAGTLGGCGPTGCETAEMARSKGVVWVGWWSGYGGGLGRVVVWVGWWSG